MGLKVIFYNVYGWKVSCEQCGQRARKGCDFKKY